MESDYRRATRGVFNKNIYKDWNRTRYVETWQKAQGYIGDRRSQKTQPTAFVHFEKLAKEWADDNTGPA